MDKRKTSLRDYGISGKRYKELCGFCEQYPEWKEELAYNVNTVKSQQIGNVSYGSKNNISNKTADLALKRVFLQKKVDLIEKTAKDAAGELWNEIIKSACYEQPFWYLRDISEIPISRSAFYDYRRYFFFLLNQRKDT